MSRMSSHHDQSPSTSPTMSSSRLERLEDDPNHEGRRDGEKVADEVRHDSHEPSPYDSVVEMEKLNRRRRDFPWKLHTMLEEVETYNQQHIVRWQADGLCFRVYNPDDFVQNIMPHYFHQTQYRSFQRMLNLYGYLKLRDGPYRGSYGHPKFIRSNPELCLQMRIQKRSKAAPSAERNSIGVAISNLSSRGRKNVISYASHAERSDAGAESTLSTPQRQNLQQQLMTQARPLPGMDQMADASMLLNCQHQQLPQQRHQNLLHQDLRPLPSVHDLYMSTTVETSIPQLDPVNTSDRITSVASVSDADSIHAIPALSLHHKQLPQNYSLTDDQGYASQHIQNSHRTELDQQRPHHRLTVLPAAWDTTVFPTHHESSLLWEEDSRINLSLLGNSWGGNLNARLKALQDPSPPVTPFSVSTRQHPIFVATALQGATSQPLSTHFVHSSRFVGPTQHQEHVSGQAELVGMRHPPHEQGQNSDNSFFYLPLGYGMEPNPFP